MSCDVVVRDTIKEDMHVEIRCTEPDVAWLYDHHRDALRVCLKHLEDYQPDVNAGLLSMEVIKR